MAVLEKLSSAKAIALEDKHGAHNYHPLPVVLNKLHIEIRARPSIKA